MSTSSYADTRPLWVRAEGLRQLIILTGTQLWGPPLCRKVREIEAIHDIARLRRMAQSIVAADSWDDLLRIK
jgi:hypothetical protein